MKVENCYNFGNVTGCHERFAHLEVEYEEIFDDGLFYFLSWLILFKLSPNIPAFIADEHGSLNLIQFASSGGRMEVILNFLVFVPLAMLVAATFKNWKLWQQLSSLVGLSLAYELLQYFFGIGATDVTDLITNSLGSLAGLLIYDGLRKITNEKFATGVAITLSLVVMIIAILISQTGLLGIRIRF